MKVAISVKNRTEGDAVKTAMDDPVTRAFVIVCGTLLQLPSDRARQRVMDFVRDKLAEDSEAQS
jgi:hypothetical protein